MANDLFKAVLAMDAYNRGYGEGIKNLGPVGSAIGNATILTDSLQTPSTNNSFAIGFYGLAYKISPTETVISYRGTDSFFGDSISGGGDYKNGFAAGIGVAGDPQATDAIDFYKAVAGTSGTALKSANILLTGHSLGAGLAGYVGAIYGKNAVIFDNMPFQEAAINAAQGIVSDRYSANTLPHSLGMAGSISDSDVMLQDIYGSTTSWQNDPSKIQMFYIPVDSFNQNYLSTYRALNPDPQTITTTQLTLAPDVPLEWTTNNKVGQGHDMTLIVMQMFGKTDEAFSNMAYWKASEKFWIPALFNTSLGAVAGGNNQAKVDGTYFQAGAFAEIMRNAIAYSSINEGTRVFGDTGIRAMFNDATDLGKALGFATSTTLKNDKTAQAISDVFVQFAGQLALGKVLQSAAPAALNGVVTLTANDPTFGSTLTVDFNQALWSTGKTAAGASGDIVGRKELVDTVFSEAKTNDAATAMKWLWNDTTASVIDKVTFATDNTAITTTLPARTVASNLVGIIVLGNGNDNITGSTNTITGGSDRDFIYGGYGDDTLTGVNGNDLLAGGAGNDRLFADKGNNFLLGGEGIDTTYVKSGVKSNGLPGVDLIISSPNPAQGETNSLQLSDQAITYVNRIIGVEKVNLTGDGDHVMMTKTPITQTTNIVIDGFGHPTTGNKDATYGDVLDFQNSTTPVYLGNTKASNPDIPGKTGTPYTTDMFQIDPFGYKIPNGLHFTNFQKVYGSAKDDSLGLKYLSPGGDLTAAQRTQLANAQAIPIMLGDPVNVGNQIDALTELARQLPQNQQAVVINAGDGNDIVQGTETGANYIYGQNGNDALRAGGFTSEVHGGAGSDVLIADGFKSQLYGESSDKDLFSLSNGAFAMDAGTEDYVSWGGVPLSGGVSQWWNEGGFAYWTPFTSILASTPFGLSDFTSLALMRLDVMPMTTVRYALGDSGQLAIQFARGRAGQAVINNYDLDLNTGAATGHVTVFQQVMEHSTIAQYTQYINLALQAAFGICITGTDPLVIDLNKNGLELTDTSRGVYFDFDNNGFAERTAWVKATDGILVRDLNSNGKIDNITEMFGNATTPGLTALRALDSNGDGKITSADTNFASLKVWQDLDKDGVTDSGELKTLAQLNITQISLASETPSVTVTHDNTIAAQSTVTFGDGTTTKMGDVRFSGNLADTKYLGNSTVSPAAAALPDLKGFGTLTNLDVAMTNDATLLSKVNAITTLPATTTWAQYETKAADVLFRWAKVDTVAPTAMGTTFDRQKLAFLEKYFGYQLAPRDASGNPTLASVDELTDSWKDVLDKSALRLAVQGPLKTLFSGITYNINDDRFHATTATSLADAYKSVLTQLSATAATAQTQWSTVWGPLLHTLDDNMDRMDRVDVKNDYVVQSLIKASDGMTLPLSLNQLLVGMAVDNAKIGTSAAETLSRSSATGTQIYYGNGGNDTLTGGTGQDVYVFGKNFGNVTINDSESAQNGDRIRFAFYNSTDVTIKSVGVDMVITVKATGNTITIKNQYEMPTVALDGHALSGQKGIEEIQFADGKIYENDDIASVVGLGTNGNDTITGTPLQDQIEGLKGDDLLQGGDDGDTYFFTRGDGNDTISDIMTAGPLNAPDALVLIGMSASDLRYTRDGGGADLKITFGWSGDSITIKDQFEYSPLGYKTKFALDERIDQILFSNGTSLSFVDVQKATLQTYLTSGNDTTYGFGTDDEFLATTGNDSLVGMDGGDVYHFGKGSGQDTIQDQSRYPETFISGLVGYSWGSDDTLIFDGSIKPSEVVFSRTGSSPDLTISIKGATDTLVIHNQFDGTKLDLFSLLGIAWLDRVEKFQFSDGTVLTWENIIKTVTTGTAGNDSLYGVILPDTLDGGTGNDYLAAGDGGDTYIFNRGYGQDTIEEGQTNVIITDPDQLKFGAGIAVTDVVFSRPTIGDLVATIKGTSDSITLKNQYDVFESGPFGTQAFSRVENFVWQDGSVKTWSEIETQIIKEAQTPGNDTVLGTFFDNTFEAGTGDDSLQGGDGADTYIFKAGFGQDTIDDVHGSLLAGDGDVVQFGPGYLPGNLHIERVVPRETAILTFAGKPDSLTIVGQFESSPINYYPQEIEQFVFGDGTVWTAADLRAHYILQMQTSGNDTISGFSRNDTIVGGLGNDSMDGQGGDDLFNINLGDGNDTVFGNVGIDTISFGAGITFETFTYTRIFDTLDMKINLPGGKYLYVNTLLDAYNLSLENFKFADGTVKTAQDIIAAYITKASTPNADSIQGFGGADSINAGAGNDTIFGDIGNDTIIGGLGNDTINAAGGDDLLIINQGEGADTIYGSTGTDTLQFGAGITFSSVVGAYVPGTEDMMLTLPGGGTVLIKNINSDYNTGIEFFKFADGTIKTTAELIAAYVAKTGTPGDDSIFGYSTNDVLDGLAGNDTIFADTGNDTITGGFGNDSMDGAGGDDLFIINKGDGNDTLFGNVGNDTVSFGAGITFNTLTYTHAPNTVDMKIGLTGGGSVLVKSLLDYYSLSLENFKFADGTVKTARDLIADYIIKAGTAVNDTIGGFVSNDSINAAAGNDSIFGDDGNDTIIGGTGNDSMDGGGNDDLFIINQGDGIDTVFGNVGEDTVSFGAGIVFNTLTYTHIPNTIDLKLDFAVGGSVLIKSILDSYTLSTENFKFADGSVKTARDLIVAYITKASTAGNDSITGFASDDSINGGVGNDSLIGGTGNDTIIGGVGNDTIGTEGGDDLVIINQGDGNDTIYDSVGDDTLLFGTGITFNALTYAHTTPNNDLIINVPGGGTVLAKNILDSFSLSLEHFKFADGTMKTPQEMMAAYLAKAGTAGNDTIMGFNTADSVSGGAGNDSINAGDNNDTVLGGTGNDSMDGGYGNDLFIINQGDGIDTINEYTGDDTIQFGVGITFNTLTYSVVTGTNDMVIGMAGGVSVYIKNFANSAIEHFVFADGTIKTALEMANASLAKQGTPGNDTIIGTSGDNSINGGAGNDSINGGYGNNTIVGGTGNDYMDCESGNDLFIINQGDGIDTVWGYAGEDTISFGAGITFNALTYTASSDGSLTIGLPSASSVLVKRIYESGIETFKFADGTIKTNADIIGAYLAKAGTAGNDSIYGFGTNDSITGGAGNDSILGGFGNNTVIGGTGNDYMDSETGNDLFVINKGDGIDTVWGYTGEDTISFGTGITFSALTYGAPGDGSLTINLPSASSVNVKRISDTGVETFKFADGTIKTNVEMIAAYIAKAGTIGNDTIYGFAFNDSINGGAGNDSIMGGLGNNTINGGVGNDYMDSENGNDLFLINQGEGNDTVYGYYGNDTISFGTGITFNALTYSATGDGSLKIGLPSTSSVSIKYIYDVGVETFKFADGTIKTNLDMIAAYIGKAVTTGNNTIYGFNGNDAINALGGNDSIIAGNGNDTITGGLGKDTLSGGSGIDWFDYNAISESAKAAPDTITDFDISSDAIDLRGLGFTGIAAGAATGTKLGFTYDSAANDTIIVSVSDFKIILDGNKALDATDFIFS